MMVRFLTLLVLGLALALAPGSAQQVNVAPSCSAPIDYTPALQGLAVPGTPTYTTQSGSYIRCGKLIHAHFAIVTTGLGGATGSILITLPTGVSIHSGGCFLSAYEGWTAPAGYTYLAGLGSAGTPGLALLLRSGSGQVNAPSDAAEWAAATTLHGTCMYPEE